MAKAATIRGIRAGTPASTALARAVAVRMRELDRHLTRVAGTMGEEPVHDARVALRRLRAALRAFGATELRSADRQAKRLQDALGGLRDRHVRLAWLEGVAGAERLAARERRGLHPAEGRVREALRAWRERGRATFLAAVAAWRLERSVLEVAGERLARHRRRVKRTRRAARDEATPEAFHALRIAFKKLRYESEFLAVAAPAETAHLLEELAPLQEHLGALHDADVRLAWLATRTPMEDVLMIEQNEQRERRRLQRAVERALARRRVGRAVTAVVRALSSAAVG